MTILPTGKIPSQFLSQMLAKYAPNCCDPRLVSGGAIGEDAAVIDMPESSSYIVAKTDPITFATEEIGFYAVNINANDLGTRGAAPKWFQATILLPEGQTTEELVEFIFADIKRACDELGISVVGGHTEVTHGLNRPIIVGNMIGEVGKDRLVLTRGAKPGDAILLTKGAPIEGTAIIAREQHSDLVRRGYDEEFLTRAKNYLHAPGISILKEALLLNEYFDVHSMHDPTEGGVTNGIAEIAAASGTGAIVDIASIPIVPEGQILCEEYNLNPLGTIASGALLVALNPNQVENAIALLNERGVSAAKIGEFTSEQGVLIAQMPDGPKPLGHSEIDEVTKIFLQL